jgi:hypothetical protein
MSVDEEGEMINHTVKSFNNRDEEMKEEAAVAVAVNAAVRGEKGERLARFWGE